MIDVCAKCGRVHDLSPLHGGCVKLVHPFPETVKEPMPYSVDRWDRSIVSRYIWNQTYDRWEFEISHWDHSSEYKWMIVDWSNPDVPSVVETGESASFDGAVATIAQWVKEHSQ